jgi:peroxiredoxin
VRELPALQKIYAKYAPKGLVIVGINTDGVDAGMIKKQFADRADLKAAGVTFALATDADFKVIDAYALMGAPLNVMIDKKGVIKFRHEGYEDGDEAGYVKVLEKLLAE